MTSHPYNDINKRNINFGPVRENFFVTRLKQLSKRRLIIYLLAQTLRASNSVFFFLCLIFASVIINIA